MKKCLRYINLFLVSLAVILFLDSCHTSKTTKTKAETLNQIDRDRKTEALLKTALSYKGTNYKAGGTSKSGMDCSGLVVTSFQKIDLNLPRTSKEQSSIGSIIKPEDATAGDLIFFATSGKAKGINHVGIVTSVGENKELRFIHSSVKAGVIEDKITEPYYQNTFVKVMRVY